MKMKKIMAGLLAAASVITFAACGNNAADNQKAGGENTASDVLRVGMECNYAPYNWSQADNSNGAVAISNVDNMYTNGYDVQVAQKIADALGKKLEIQALEWDSLVPGVQSGKLDMIIAGMSPTADRREKIDFSNNYYTSNLVVVTKKGGLADVKTIADLKDKKIAAQSGTFHLQALNEQTEAKASEMTDFSAMLIALKAGTIDGYIAEEPTAMAVIQDPAYGYVSLENNKTGFKVDDDEVSIAVGVKKGSDLKEKINGAIASLDSAAQKELMQKMVNMAPTKSEE